KDYSVHDVLRALSKIYVVELEGARVLNEIPGSAQKLLEKLEVDILPKTWAVSVPHKRYYIALFIYSPL
ncbi:MAG: hypothetical protein QW531_04185, partial [Thermoplasmata archaeon]